jgi:hypothetical protein
MDFCDVLCWGLLRNSVDQMEVLLKSDKRHFSWRTVYVCINILPFKVSTKNMIFCHLLSKYKNQSRTREAKETVVDLNIIRCHIGMICMLGNCAKNLNTSQWRYYTYLFPILRLFIMAVWIILFRWEEGTLCFSLVDILSSLGCLEVWCS